jgi:hypothetical protein
MKVVTLPIIWTVFRKTAKTRVLPSTIKASLETSRVLSSPLENCPKYSLQDSELEFASTMTVTPAPKTQLVARWQKIDGRLICQWGITAP